MRDLNNVQLIGHLGHDPEVRYLDNGTALTTFSIATNYSYATGEERQTETEWHRRAAWGRLGKLCAQYLHKGSRTYIEGRLRSHRWEDESRQLRTIVEIVVHDLILLDRHGGAHVPTADGDDGLPFEGGSGADGRQCSPLSPTAQNPGDEHARP